MLKMSLNGESCTWDQTSKPHGTHTSRCNSQRNFNGYQTLQFSDRDDRLKDAIVLELVKVAPTAESSARANRCRDELASIVRQLGSEWEVRPFGSFANGFATVSSDLDVTCCQVGQASSHDLEMPAVSALTAIAQVLRDYSSFSIEEQILGARVPILKLRFENCLDIDLSCHNPTPLLNTRLLRAYSRMDPRVRDLGVAIKLWSKRTGVCDATKSNLSSYSFTLLVIYFLQVHPDVQLPILPVEAFEDCDMKDVDLQAILSMKSWQCGLSVSELMLRFFSFYSNHDSNGFSWGDEVVSVRLGERHMSHESVFPRLRGRHVQRLHIEDPYQLERNLHGVLGEVEEEQLRAAFRDTFTDLQQQQVPYAFSTHLAAPAPFVREMERISTALPVNSGEKGMEDAICINDLVQLYRKTKMMGSCADSTNSGSTRQEIGSDDSGDDSRLSGEVCEKIPWPEGLCKKTPAPTHEMAHEDDCNGNHVICIADGLDMLKSNPQDGVLRSCNIASTLPANLVSMVPQEPQCSPLGSDSTLSIPANPRERKPTRRDNNNVVANELANTVPQEPQYPALGSDNTSSSSSFPADLRELKPKRRYRKPNNKVANMLANTAPQERQYPASGSNITSSILQQAKPFRRFNNKWGRGEVT